MEQRLERDPAEATGATARTAAPARACGPRHAGGPAAAAAALLLLGVAATQVLTYWSRDPAALASPVPGSAPQRAAARPSPYGASGARNALEPAANAPSSPAPSKRATEPALPVQVYFHRRAAHLDTARRGQRSFLSEGRIVNLSSQALAIDVVVTNATTLVSQQAVVDVPPHAQADFGADEGLLVHPNDAVKLRSARYQDLVTAAR